MKAVRIYPTCLVFAGSGEWMECSAAEATRYAVYAVCEEGDPQTFLADFGHLDPALHLAETLSSLLNIPLQDAHNLKGI